MKENKFTEEELSAFLDGELPPNLATQIEAELQVDPQLLARLEQLRRVDRFSRLRQVPLPPEGYFEQLAARIDAGIAREIQPERKSWLRELFSTRLRWITVAGSTAAVVLAAVIGVQLFEPQLQQYQQPVPLIDRQPGATERDKETKQEETEPLTQPSSTQLRARGERKDQPQPSVILQEERKIDQPVSVQRDEPQPHATLESAVPVEQRNGVDQSDSRTETATPAIVDVTTRDVAPKKTIELLPQESAPTAKPLSLPSPKQKTTPESYSTAAALAEIPAGKERRAAELKALLAAGDWESVAAQLRAKRAEERQITIPVYEGSQEWEDSLAILGPERWFAENGWRRAKHNRYHRDDVETAIILIDHLLVSKAPADSLMWQSRRDTLRKAHPLPHTDPDPVKDSVSPRE